MKKLYIFIFAFLLLPSAFLLSQWVQQTLPVSGLINDICFFDANTGLVSMDTPALLKTTNGGVNWTVINNLRIYNFNKIDDLAVYSNGRLTGVDKIYRSFDKGITWDSVSPSTNGAYFDLSFVNRDTGWVSGFNGIINVIYRSTDGGISLVQQSDATGFGRIFFLKSKINGQYYGWNANSYLFYTTNSGFNWTQYTNMPNNNAGSIFFLNRDTGWVSNFGGSLSQRYFMHTLNNGSNWIEQNLPIDNGIGDIYFYSYLKGWGGAGFGKIYATTNGGELWGYQNVPIPTAGEIFFIDDLTGWCGGNGICKTTNGGGNIIYNGVHQIGSEVPVSYKLFQNYPNPFNSTTNFKFQIPKSSYVKIILYDILGRVVDILVDNYFNVGIYKVYFNANNVTSGIYFYRLTADNYVETKKMILIK